MWSRSEWAGTTVRMMVGRNLIRWGQEWSLWQGWNWSQLNKQSKHLFMYIHMNSYALIHRFSWKMLHIDYDVVQGWLSFWLKWDAYPPSIQHISNQRAWRYQWNANLSSCFLKETTAWRGRRITSYFKSKPKCYWTVFTSPHLILLACRSLRTDSISACFRLSLDKAWNRSSVKWKDRFVAANFQTPFWLQFRERRNRKTLANAGTHRGWTHWAREAKSYHNLCRRTEYRPYRLLWTC